MRARERDRIARLEATGVIGDLRGAVGDWSRRNPLGTYLDAMRDLIVPEYLVGVVDAALVDVRAGERATS